MTKKIFEDIYSNKFWDQNDSGQTVSSSGSSLAEGRPFINYINNFLNTFAIDSIVDLGCGDWVLAKEINWGNRNYLGVDAASQITERNEKLYGSSNILFICLDANRIFTKC